MRLPLTLHVFYYLCFATTSTLAAISLSKPNCQEKCGNITIPYPFGIGPKCSVNSFFTVICQNSTTPPKPLLSSINLEILNISMHGIVIVNQPVVHMNCSGGALSISLEGTPYTISPQYNTLVVTGCNILILSTIGGCTATCDANSTDTTCNGVNCCQVEVPRMKEIHLTYQSIKASNNSFCGYVFLVDRKWYTGLVNDLSNPFNHEFGVAPLVLEWEFRWGEFLDDGVCLYCEQNSTNRYRNPDDYGCWFSVDVYDHHYRTTDHDYTDNSSDYASSIGYCSCLPGFDGNPYIAEGCSDVDECSNAALNDCAVCMACINEIGGFSCRNTTGIYDYEDDENDGFETTSKGHPSLLAVCLEG